MNFKSIVQAVEKQLKLRIRIPAQFREYGIRVIERWHRDDVKWLRGGSLKFCDPHADHMKTYRYLRYFYNSGLRSDMWAEFYRPNFPHPNIHYMSFHPKQLKKEDKQRKKSGAPKIAIGPRSGLPEWA